MNKINNFGQYYWNPVRIFSWLAISFNFFMFADSNIPKIASDFP